MTTDEQLDEGTATLPDGRRLGWMQWGVADGEPVLLLNGNPGSRLFRPDPETLRAAGVRLVTVDRPGVGRSTPRPGRRMIDWPEDVAELADALEIDRFGIVGISMGGPHALACAAMMPDRITHVAVHGSPGPWSEPGFGELAPPQMREMRDAFARDPAAAEQQYRRAITEQRRVLLDQPAAAFEAFLSRLTEPDQRLYEDPGLRRMAQEDAAEAVREGIEGFFEERMAGYVLDWGFELDQVKRAVTVTHGVEDVWVPVQIGRELARRLPDAQLQELEGAGHFPPPSLFGAILATVVGRAPHAKDARR